jgi:hypothetical protein
MASTIQLKTGTGSAVPSSLTQGEVAINIDNGLFYFGSGSSEAVKILESFTHITASGNISASGDIITTKLRDSVGNNHIVFGNNNNTIAISSDDVEIMRLDGDSQRVGINKTTPGEALEVVGNISSSGGIVASSANIEGHLVGKDSGLNDSHLTGFTNIQGYGNFTMGNSETIDSHLITGKTNFVGNVTASANISASGTIIATSFTGSLQGNALTATTASFAQTASYVENAQTASYVENAQTASFVTLAQTASYVENSQTASYVENAQTASYVENAQTASYVENAQTASYVENAQTASYVENAQTASFVNTLNQSVTITGAITASSNISASGYLIAQNITASNISASGYIYGRQFEQLDSVADTIVINTSYVYLPLGGQSLLEQALTTNKNVQKLAIAPGKLRKVIIRVTSLATGLGTTGFTCSYHSAIPGANTVNVVGEKYANSLGTSHEVVTFDFTTGLDGGTSWDDVTPGSRVYLSLKADTSLDSISHLGVASLWEWDYNA